VASEHTESTTAIEHIFRAWDDALGAKDLDAAMALYHPDATLESPLVCHLLGTEEGVVPGREALRCFVERVFAHQPRQRRRHHTGFLSDGTTLTWQYTRQSPDGDQMDIIEVMDIRDGLIRHHRVYWGWYSVRLIKTGQHPAEVSVPNNAAACGAPQYGMVPMRHGPGVWSQ
jgi:ketosteroid isomerase-like protein